jgi:predicted NBD/HSP70 family sugar kinase
VETVVSSGAIVEALRDRLGRRKLTLAAAVDLARAENPAAVEVFADAGRVLGAAVASMVNMVGPELVLIMGESAPDFDLYSGHLRESLAAQAFGSAGDCRIVVRPHSIEDWARGAAASVLRMVVRQEFP